MNLEGETLTRTYKSMATFKSALEQYPSPRPFGVAWEYNDRRGRKWNITSFNEFCKGMQEENKNRRHFHEMIFPNRPCKLYFDLDDKKNEYKTEEEWNVEMEKIKTATLAKLKRKFNLENVKISEWTAHGSGVRSEHHVYDVWFENPSQVKKFVKELQLWLGCPKCLDMSPYASSHDGSTTSMRMPYCTKFKENRFFVPKGKENDAEFDLAKFCEGLICTCSNDPNHPLLPFPSKIWRYDTSVDKEVQLTGDERVNTIIDLTHPEMIEGLDRMVAWFERLYKHNKRVIIQKPVDPVTGKFELLFDPGIYCRRKDGVHDNNKTYLHGGFRSKYDIYAYTVCADASCRVPIRLKHRFPHIAFPQRLFSLVDRERIRVFENHKRLGEEKRASYSKKPNC